MLKITTGACLGYYRVLENYTEHAIGTEKTTYFNQFSAKTDEMQRNYGSEDTEEAVSTTDNPTTPFPTPPTSIISPRSPIPLHRQASPFPLESINQPRRINYQSDRLRNVTVPGEVIYASGNKKATSNNVVASTLGRNSGTAAGRRHRMAGMTSSSSATSCNSSNGNDNIMQPNGDVPYHHVEQHTRRLSNDVSEDSPPEPAPPEIPPRGGSLHLSTLRRKAEFQILSNGEVLSCEDVPYRQADYVLGGSPRASVFPVRSPMAPQPANANNQHRMATLQQTQLAQSLQQPGGQTNTLTAQVANQPSAPMMVPVFPIRPAPPPSSSHYSPYSPSRFHIDKRCQYRCSWKCSSIGLILLTVLLTGMLTYFAAVSSMKSNIDTSNCILVQDVKDGATQGQMTMGSESTQTSTEESLPTSTAEHSSATTQHSSLLQSAQQQQQWSPLPLEQRELDILHTAIIPPYQFWHSEFRNKQPAFFRFNFTLPWGANFAVYGRRNVAPSITQYDFVKFVKGGRVDHRLKKRDVSSHDVQTEVPEDLRKLPKLKLFPESRNSYKSDVLDSISNSYEGTRKILADSEPRGPYYVPPNIKIDYIKEVADSPTKMTDIPHPKTNFDIPDDEKHMISKRDAGLPEFADSMMVNVSLLQYLDTGRWFLSVYNDELQPYSVSLVISEAEGVSPTCPNDCSGRGSCYLGKCDCIDGFQGIDCSKSVCPVLCSGHGQYGGGICHCEEGWKGPECDIPEGDCRIADCSGHGKCVRGFCQCKPGWKGESCEETDCNDPTCSEHGACVHGQCYCKAGWKGVNCDVIDEQVHKCLPSCSEHGIYDLESAKCVCNRHWTGSDCSQPLCNLDCGDHGHCELGKCKCDIGWTGLRCEQLPCDTRCQEHGQCKNGTCVCSQGWNGRHCTLPGCENACSGHGQCTLEEGQYKCVCIDGWAGFDCSIRLESECQDDTDDDHDGMMDCSDSECCSHPACTDHIMCISSNDPVEVLLRKQPPSVTASFYQRVKFLIEENSVQSYAHLDEYTESEFWNSFTPRRVAVMRGQVISPQGLGIVGIRVAVDKESKFGFTLTRPGGWFDVLVNGGGAVTLQFQRSPFKPKTITVYVPWNQIIVLPPIHMQLAEDSESHHLITRSPALYFPGVSRSFFDSDGSLPNVCEDHDPETLRPIITGTWMPEAVGGMQGRSAIFAETQIVQESIPIPGSNLNILYQSSQALGYLTTIEMKLTGSKIPSTLTHVHVRVEIEGCLYVKTYEADPDLYHTFAWNKRNIYKQKVYGTATAKVSIGYQFSNCQDLVWITQTTEMKGFDVDISDIGAWGLDIHHHYNFYEGILQKGDGSTLHFKKYPRMVKVVMGTGLQRSVDCPGQCGGPAKDARLLTPGSLASGPDGSVYVGDFNLVRRITPEGNVYTILQLRTTQVAYKYYLAISPADGHLYVSDPERHQILKVLSLEPVQDPTINSEPIVGNGERCIPGDDTACGDEGPAKQARLAHPKGIAIAVDGTMYIADGTNIRAVDQKGVIHTLIGNHGHQNHWIPIPCQGAISASQAQLQWPTGLALSPLDGAIHFIDDRLILKLSPEMKVSVVAGKPLHCHKNENITGENNELGTVLALAFNPNGELYIAESDTRNTYYVRLIDTAGKITHFAGKLQPKDRKCQCAINATTANPVRNSRELQQECLCPPPDDTTNNAETLLSSNAVFQTISAIGVSPGGVLYIADQGSLHILALEHYLPTHDENGEFRIPYPSSGEVYVFNRYGQHVATKDLASDKTRYSFLYSKNTSFGKLSTVTDSSGNKIQFLRDYSNAVSSIENTQDHKSELKMSGMGYLSKLSEKGRSEIELDYDQNTGLLLSRSGGGDTIIYQYDGMGRATGVILPSGETLQLNSKMSTEGLEVSVSQPPTTLNINGNANKQVILIDGAEITKAITLTNSTVALRTPSESTLEICAVERHPLLEASLPIEAELLPVWSKQTTTLGDQLSNVMSTTFSLVGDVRNPQQTLYREILVNHSKILGVEFNQFTSKETFFDSEKLPLLTVTYDPAGLPLTYTPYNGADVLNLTYDSFNRIDGWKWGESQLKFSYNRHGLLSEVTSPQDGIQIFTYDETNMLTKITLASQRNFLLSYDDNGGLRHVTLPSGTKHSFALQPSLGIIRVTYTPPGSTRAYLQHFSNSGKLLQTVLPGEGVRIVYRYYNSGKLKEVVHGDGKSLYNYSETTGFPSQVSHVEKDLEYQWDYQYTSSLLTEERISFGAKTGLSNAKFTYAYDNNYRLTGIQGRIGGQNLPLYNLAYNFKTGAIEQIGPFKIIKLKANETQVYDGTALFSSVQNSRFLEARIALTIHGMEVFKMEFNHDLHGRISQTRTYTKNVGVNTYTNIKNYTWDCDGQLLGVEAQEPWGFRYDDNGNMLSLTYRGNTIPMEYNSMDRIIKFGEGQYKYDSRGLVVQNAREEKFHYNSKGLLTRATKKGRFDVRYFYDHIDRLLVRKDNFGNITQFFYNNDQRPQEVTQIYSPRDGKLMSLVYDNRGHLIYAQVYRHKYYIATDQCGTPVMIFNQYGEAIREIMRSPYGHIVYDSNPYLYLPIDFCGGILDQVTSLVHMTNGKVYDPLIGQWMSPLWENVLERVATPTQMHLYRLNGNDPINLGVDRDVPKDHIEWLNRIGVNLKSLAPQLFMDQLPGGSMPPSLSNKFSWKPGEVIMSQLITASRSTEAESGFLAHINARKMESAKQLSVYFKSALKTDVVDLVPRKIGASSDPPFGKGILVSKSESGEAIVSSVPAANPIYSDVYTSVFNRSFLLPFFFVVHSNQQDAFYFIKKDSWKINDDKAQLKRLQGQVNTTFHENVRENGSGNNYFDVKIHGANVVINLRYGTTMEKEKQRLLHHAKLSAIRKAWHKEKEASKNGFYGSMDWSQSEIDELVKNGYINNYEGQYIHDVQQYPELAEDPYNIRFVKKQTESTKKGRRKRETSRCSSSWWLTWSEC
ncbi:teneurin-a isoform X3 [Anthonomus grandis grandis]|uniref:teneurin-a isoform X3 n=1 Tax=Anthonomus grandis grandis TaxID=2921223 RepID=UPI0021650CB9|nr:teneurin-a isoform X3 [Anthonomus grandis grandis]